MSETQRLTNRAVADTLAGVAARLQILDANRFRMIAFQNAGREHSSFGPGHQRDRCGR